MVAYYQKLDPADSAYFAAQETRFNTVGLARYHAAIAAIKRKYAGTKVGASESIFAMLAPALGLDLITPPSFLKAISEGGDVTASDKETIDNQIKSHEIKIYVYNSQNATPDVQTQINEAKAQGIPVTTITETLSPAGASFQQWQVAQLTAHKRAEPPRGRVARYPSIFAPPSTWIAEPVIAPARSEHRNATAKASSSGRGWRLIGCISRARWALYSGVTPGCVS